jgi:hypothetical protein
VIIKVKKNFKSERQEQNLASIKTVRVVKMTATETAKEVEHTEQRRVTFRRPLTEAHARAAVKLLFA